METSRAAPRPMTRRSTRGWGSSRSGSSRSSAEWAADWRCGLMPTADSIRLRARTIGAGTRATTCPPLHVGDHFRHVLPREAITGPAEARERDPLRARRIIGRLECSRAPASDVVEIHGRKESETVEVVAIPVEPEPLGGTYTQAGLFHQLPARREFDRLPRLDESPRSIEKPTLGRVGAPQ